MNRYGRTRILVEGNLALAQKLAAQIEKNYSIETLDAPHEELIMVQVRESARNSLFYLSEALMCSCKVRLGTAIGFGMVLGSKRNLAYNLAVIDAAFESKTTESQRYEWETLIEEEAERMKTRRIKAERRLAKTKIDFSTMKLEV